MLKVHEIFKSVQGEGIRRGYACIFVRVSGCSLNCSWCDSRYALETYTAMTVDEVLKKVVALSRKYKTKLVENTGGEPLLYPDIEILTQQLLQKGFTVLIETNGSIPLLENLMPNPNLHHIVDIKPPSSGMHKKTNWNIFRNQITKYDEIKFVIADDNDANYAIQTIRKCNLTSNPILISPVWTTQVDLQTGLARFEKIRMAVADLNENIIYQPQLHKVIWGPTKRGV